jgi:hypothetical protein
MRRNLLWSFAFLAVLAALSMPRATAQSDDKDKDKGFDAHTSVGDMHLGNDGSAHEVGLPLYPGARPKKNDKDDSSSANLSLFTSAFGFKLVVVSYESDDAPGKLVAYYREKLTKYGKVLECHTKKHGGDVDPHAEDDESASKSKELKCEGDNSGPITELKVGTEDNERLVAVEPAEKGTGSTFSLVYVRSRGKQGDI